MSIELKKTFPYYFWRCYCTDIQKYNNTKTK